MAEPQFLPSTRHSLSYPLTVHESLGESKSEPPPPAEGKYKAPVFQGREVRQTRQRVLFCRCGSSSIWARGLCQRCYSRVRADEKQFAGLRERVLERDGHTCQGCQATSVETVLAVHHRQPGVSALDLLVTLCPACHAIVERTEVLFRDVPELLRVLWRELHPEASEQLPLFAPSTS
jgi:5-methylcytosine-specific restriction endonuclease McrA